MQRTTIVTSLTALFLLASAAAFGAGGDKTKVKGIITSRTGETLILGSAEGGSVTVVLTDSARDLLDRIRAQRSGALSLVIGNGCCDSTAPFLFEAYVAGPNEARVGVANVETSAELLSLPVEPEDLVAILSGRVAPPKDLRVAEILPPDRTDEVLAQSDFVLLLLPATPDTDNLIDAKRLARMKPGAWLLNFGRGHLIKDDDLIAAAKAKKIAGAVLDVFRQEPLPAEHPFWSAEGIVVLPHIGGPHPQRDRFVAHLFVDNLGRFLDGAPLKEIVDRAAGY